MTQRRKYIFAALCFLGCFVLWTIAIQIWDVQPIGPQGSAVGFATVNRTVHDAIGVHMGLYVLTDWLGLMPIAFVACFGLQGLTQWIRRKRLCKVDRDILVLGGFYLLVMAAYIVFELYTVNYRPVLIEGRLETSYPSSTTMLVLCVMPTVINRCNARITHRRWRICLSGIIALFMAFMVIARLLSGVHWLSDILGGILLSAGLVSLYLSATKNPDR